MSTPMRGSIFLSIPLLCLATLSINCRFVSPADAQDCGGEGVADPDGADFCGNRIPQSIVI
jgi:hypothetical protein